MPRNDFDYAEYVKRRDTEPPRLLYKYTTASTARAILTSGRLRFQSPLQYNDPFDAQWEPTWQLRTPEAIAVERRLLNLAFRDPGSWPPQIPNDYRRALLAEQDRINSASPELRESVIANMVEEAVSTHVLPKGLAERMQAIRRRLRVLCLCANDSSILMWSHYGDQHRGVLFGFETSVLEAAFRRPLEPVVYSNEPPEVIDVQAWHRRLVFGVDEVVHVDGYQERLVLTKHSDWSYEQEWRFVWSETRDATGEFRDFEYPDGAMVEVSLGARMCDDDAAELSKLCKMRALTARMYKMRKHPCEFSLEKLELTD